MYYMVGKKPHNTTRVVVVIWAILGLMIGVSLGLYVAAKTLPLPVTTNNNFYRAF